MITSNRSQNYIFVYYNIHMSSLTKKLKQFNNQQPFLVNSTGDSLALLWLDERSRVRQSITRHPISLCSCDIGSISDSAINNSRYSSTLRANYYFLTITNILTHTMYITGTYIFSHPPLFPT